MCRATNWTIGCGRSSLRPGERDRPARRIRPGNRRASLDPDQAQQRCIRDAVADAAGRHAENGGELPVRRRRGAHLVEVGDESRDVAR